jgi:beta-lactam-binding protein with PASTA domain/tRNA A-37 threonylcarbamoyl transferase component Bud32
MRGPRALPPYHRGTVPETSPPIHDADVIGGRYRLLDEIGRGGMATVLRARDEVLGRDVALKMLHDHLADDDAFIDRFRREARSAAALSHPNVVALYDWGEGDDGSYMVLELVDGMSLRDVIRIRGRVAPAEALALLGPAAAGLHAAHRAGLVHRDVKPENVLLADDGTVKVTDFGLARAAASSTQTFGADVIVGSPHYLCPEAVDGQPLDARADVYALGVLLYEVLVGRPPFEGDSPLATALQHTTNTVPRPSGQVSGISADVDQVVRTATARDPDERYPDAGAFAEALALAVPEGPSPVDLRDGQRNTVVLPVDATDTLIATGSGADGSATRATSRDEATGTGNDTARPRRRGRRLLFVLLLLTAAALGGLAAWDQVIAPITSVPSVVGDSEADATAQLEEAGFAVEVTSSRAFDVEIPVGHVVRQDPVAEARRGATVQLTLSAGPAQVDVPELRDTDQAAAEERLDGLGLTSDVELVFDEEVEAGRVVATEPTSGTVVDEGSQVLLRVSQGRRPIEVPSLAGMAASDAFAALEELGLTPREADRVYHAEVPEGAVISTSPGAGERLFQGDEVELVISRGAEPFPMPDVRDGSEEEARATLEALGLEVRVEYVDTVFVFRSGNVDEQDPAPGKLVREGDTVTIYVWR